jgi:hypothetical protein
MGGRSGCDVWGGEAGCVGKGVVSKCSTPVSPG